MDDGLAQLNEDIARGLKKDGLSADEVRVKLTGVHGVGMAEALLIVEKVFGAEAMKKSRSGHLVSTGLALMAAGLAGGAVVYFAVGFHPLRVAIPSYALAFGAFSSGLIALARAVTRD